MLLLSVAVCCSAARWPLPQTTTNTLTLTHTHTEHTMVLFLWTSSTNPLAQLLYMQPFSFPGRPRYSCWQNKTKKQQHAHTHSPTSCLQVFQDDHGDVATWKDFLFFSKRVGGSEWSPPRVGRRRQLSYLLTVQLPPEPQRNVFSIPPRN